MIGVGMFFKICMTLHNGDLTKQKYKVWRSGFLNKEHLQKIDNTWLLFSLYQKLVFCCIFTLKSSDINFWRKKKF